MEMLKGSLIKSIYVAGLGSVLLFSSVSCTKATPKMEQLKSLSGLAVTSKVVSINNGAVATMTGTCSKVFTDFEVSFDNGEWVAAKDLDPNLQNNCTSSGTFTISFDSSNPIYADDLALQPASVTAAVRGLSEYGKSTADSMVINIIYAGAAGAPNPPTGINLYDPLIAISTDNTPSVSVSGVVAGDYVKVFTDGSCSVGNQVGGDIAAGPTAIIQLSTLADGNYTFYANSTNGVGPSNCSAVNVSYTVDTTAAYVTNITASTANGSYKTGTVDVQITFSEAVTVNTGGGTPRLKLNSNVSAYANYSSGSGTNTLTFTYSIAAGHNSLDLDYDSTAALALNGGSIVDQVLLSSNLTLPSPGAANSLGGNKAIVVDTLAPTLDSIVFNTANGTYGPNTSISLTLTFSEPVTTTGTPTLTFSNGKTTTCANISNSLTMSCSYNTGGTGSGSTGNNLSVTSVSLSASDAATNSFAGTMPGNSSSINIDTTAPTIDSVAFANSNTNCLSATCGPGEVITVTLIFSKNITAAVSNIDFNNTKSASCAAVVASTSTTCTYTVGATGSLSDIADLTVDTTDISAADAYGNTLDTSIPANSSGLALDTTAPVIQTVTTPLLSQTYNTVTPTPDNIDVELNFDESVNVSGSPFVRINTVPNTQSAYFYSTSSTATKKVFRWTAAAGNHTTDLDAVSVSLSGGSIKDLYGNDADLSLPAIADRFVNTKDVKLNYVLDTTVDSIYSNYWNDYVKNNGVDAYSADGTACDTANDRIYGNCIHSGEKKKIIVPGFNDCNDLILTEGLNAFDWECKVSGSNAIFYTLGLREEKGLDNLVSSTSWNTNTVTIFSTSLGMNIVTSSTGMTWDNPITNFISSTLNSTSTIYVVDSNILPTNGIQITNDKIALVVKNGFSIGSGRSGSANNCNSLDIISTPNSFALVFGSNLSHLWIEGRFNAKAASSANFGLIFAGLKFSRLHNLLIGGTAYTSGYIGSGIALLNGSHSNMINNSNIANIGANGIYLDAATSYNTLVKLSISNGGSSSGHGGINLASGSTNNYISRITAFNYNHSGIYVNSGATNNLFSHITSTNNGTVSPNGKGVNLAAANNTFNQILAANNYKVGFDITTAHNSRFSQIVLIANGNPTDNYYPFTHASDNTVFKYNFIFNGTCPPAIGGANPGLTSNTCTGINATAAGPLPFYLVTTGVPDLNTVFKGYLSTADASNTTAGNPGPVTPTDYVKFENIFRGWGFPESYIASSANKGKCMAGCKIMDWSYSLSDTILRNMVGPNRTADPFVNPNPIVQDCPASVNGDVVMTSLQSPAITFLVNAVEIVGDSKGNENGLCEINEICIYTPNYGSYVGEGDLKLCNFKANGGPVTGVTMYGYSNNGY